MNEFMSARIKMVDCQVRPADVTDHDIIETMLAVPREEFVPEHLRQLAYIDEDLPLGTAPVARYMLEPASFARMAQLVHIGEDDIVLDVGCATGYSAAVLSNLCASLVALECDEALAGRAADLLAELGHDNAVVVTGPLEGGYPSEGPYDVIFVGGAVARVPDALKRQLKDGGRMVLVEGTGNAASAVLYRREGDRISSWPHFNCAVPLLPGFEVEEEFEF